MKIVIREPLSELLPDIDTENQIKLIKDLLINRYYEDLMFFKLTWNNNHFGTELGDMGIDLSKLFGIYRQLRRELTLPVEEHTVEINTDTDCFIIGIRP